MNKFGPNFRIFTISALAALIALGFQSCGDGLHTNAELSSYKQSLLADGLFFQAGETVRVGLIPYAHLNQTQLNEYLSLSLNKAMAITRDGRNYWANHALQSQANKWAVQICQYLSGVYCAHFLSGSTIVVNSASFDSTFVDHLALNSTVSASNLPFITLDSAGVTALNNYLAANTVGKAIAISPEIGGWWYHTSSASQAEARTKALATCNANASAARVGPCILYAEGNSVVYRWQPK